LSSNYNRKTVVIWSLDHTLRTAVIKVCYCLRRLPFNLSVHKSVTLCVKLPLLRIFLWLMLKFTAPERNLKWAFHDVCLSEGMYTDKSMLSFPTHFSAINCQCHKYWYTAGSNWKGGQDDSSTWSPSR